MNITKVAITRPIFIFMLMAVAIILGTISYRSMRVELQPEVNFGVVTISTTYPGAGPDDINELVSRKIEQAVSGVNGLREVTSTSQEGISVVVVTLELGVDVDAALNDVRSKVDSVTNSLPKDALKPQVSKQDTTSTPILSLSLAATGLNSQELRDLIDDKLSDRYAQIPGVASASVNGGDTREIQVQVSKDKLLQYGIGISDIQQAVSNASLNAPSGKLLSGTQEYSVRVKSQFETKEQVANMIITVSDPKQFGGKGRTLRLTDVATVTDAVRERTSYARLDGKDSISLSIQKTREGNAVEITALAEKVNADIEKEFKGQGLKITKTFEQATQIKDSLNDVVFSLAFGIVLVSAIVYIFLHNFRGTLIVALAIPTSIFATFIALKGAGFTINNLSMLSLVLAVGVLVDDAIVVLENIYRHLRLGEDPREAALNGRNEIGLAALAITMADVVVFLPIAFMQGIVGQFFKPLALGFVFAVLFSLFISFTLTPLLAARWYRKGEDMEHPTGRFAIWFNRNFAKFEGFYGRALEWALNHRWFVFILGNSSLFAIIAFIAGGFQKDVAGAVNFGLTFTKLGLFLGVISMVVQLLMRKGFKPKILLNALAFGLIFPVAATAGFGFGQWKQGPVFKFGFLPDSDGGQVNVNIELPPGSNLAATEAIVRRAEAIVMKNPEVKYTVSNVGSQGFGNGVGTSGSNYAQISATLWEKEAFFDRMPWVKHKDPLRKRSSESVAAQLTLAVGRIPGAVVKISAASGFNFGSAIQLSMTSSDRPLLLKTVQNIRDRLASGAVKGVINADLSSKPGKPELQIVPDRLALADQGITVASTGQAIRTLYQGNDDTKLRVNGREYNVRVMMDLKDRDNPQLLNEVPLRFVQGEAVYLGQVAKIEQAPAVDKITRRQRAEEITVTADILPGFANGSVAAEVANLLKTEKLVPEGVVFKPLGQADAQAREGAFVGGAFLLGIVLVYMLLASLYDNLLYPFIIQLSQPQAIVGAILALVLTDKSLNLIGIIGIVTLAGLVGKNAILLVDYTNTLREEGRNRHDALVEAGPIRLRPIMMTTLALILGTLPIALALGRGSEFRETIGITIIGGMTLSTFLTLLVIPCSYTIFDDLTLWIAKVTGHRSHFEQEEMAAKKGL